MIFGMMAMKQFIFPHMDKDYFLEDSNELKVPIYLSVSRWISKLIFQIFMELFKKGKHIMSSLIYAIGDIHGRDDLLECLHEKIVAYHSVMYPGMNAVLIHIGMIILMVALIV